MGLRRTVLCILVWLAAAVPALAQPRDKPMPGDFVVIDGRVDAGTYAGGAGCSSLIVKNLPGLLIEGCIYVHPGGRALGGPS